MIFIRAIIDNDNVPAKKQGCSIDLKQMPYFLSRRREMSPAPPASSIWFDRRSACRSQNSRSRSATSCSIARPAACRGPRRGDAGRTDRADHDEHRPPPRRDCADRRRGFGPGLYRHDHVGGAKHAAGIIRGALNAAWKARSASLPRGFIERDNDFVLFRPTRRSVVWSNTGSV